MYPISALVCRMFYQGPIQIGGDVADLLEISDEEALHIKEVSEEKIADKNIQQTVAAH